MQYTLCVHFVGQRKCDLLHSKQRTMFLHRSKEELEELVRITKEDLRRKAIAERLAKTPCFNVMSHKKT